MSDLSLDWGGDLQCDANGDLLLSEDERMTNQRIVRRLLTNPGEYIWNLSYGGGLALSVGEPADASAIEAVIRQQLQMEAAVASSPAATVVIQSIDPASGAFIADIVYSDSTSGGSSKLSIPQG
jgi:hypothetical protein